LFLSGQLDEAGPSVHPKCIARENGCLPEDVAGVRGYERLRLVLANPGLRQHAELRDWAGNGSMPAASTPSIRTCDVEPSRNEVAVVGVLAREKTSKCWAREVSNL